MRNQNIIIKNVSPITNIAFSLFSIELEIFIVNLRFLNQTMIQYKSLYCR